jgi:cytosine/adenosine deaminase-related metal-dependent hydrolase
MLTANPARAAGVGDRKGLLTPGDADILIFDASLTLQATMRGGAFVYATEEWRSVSQPYRSAAGERHDPTQCASRARRPDAYWCA